MKLLEQSQTAWQRGDWTTLRQLAESPLDQQSERAQIASYIAAAYHQLAQRDETLHWSEQALAWGCEKAQLGRILVAGVFNTLGRCAALLEDEASMNLCFLHAVALSEEEDVASGRIRAIHELTDLGLLDKAATLFQHRFEELERNTPPSQWLSTHLSILKTELELLQCELILAQRRGQLHQILPEPGNEPTSHADAEKDWMAKLQKKATSQLGQDLWVLEKTSYKRGGFFVEFGATNGILLSNTYLLEREFGWNGICAEPNPHFITQLRSNRLCRTSSACIGPRTGEQVEFIFADVYGGMAQDADDDPHKEKRAAYRNAGAVAELTTISLHDFLMEQAAPNTIDYLSIDTEGSEFPILQTFPFNEWNIRLITVEHNFTDQREKIRSLLESFGYRCQEAQFDDWYYRD